MTMSEEQTGLAAEYALGTLSSEERAEAEALIASDAAFARLVDAWQLRLAELSAMVASAEPPIGTWDKIRKAIADVAQAPMALPSVGIGGAEVIQLAARARRWRGIAALTTAAAAAVTAIAVLQAYDPDRLPAPLRVKPRIETRVETKTETVRVEVPAPQPAQFVAVLQSGPQAPAFIMSVDVAAKTFTVRRVAAESEAGKSYELWLVSDKFPQPKSLGVIGSDDYTARALATYDADTISKATYAVSVEPEGGSPTGVATGPIVFTGKLVEAVPPGNPPAK